MPGVEKNYTLDDIEPELQQFLAKEPSEPQPFTLKDVDGTNEEITKYATEATKRLKHSGVRIFNKFTLNPDSDKPLRLRAYLPQEAHSADKIPILYFAHGGGMVVGLPEQDEAMLARFAKETPPIAVASDYRPAPQNPYPTPLQDCYLGLRWMILAGAKEFHADPDRIAVAGASAGGNLALALALMARNFNYPKLNAVRWRWTVKKRRGACA